MQTYLIGPRHYLQLQRAELLQQLIEMLQGEGSPAPHYRRLLGAGSVPVPCQTPAISLPEGISHADVSMVEDTADIVGQLKQQLQQVRGAFPEHARGYPLLMHGEASLRDIVRVYSPVYNVSLSATSEGWVTILTKKVEAPSA